MLIEQVRIISQPLSFLLSLPKTNIKHKALVNAHNNPDYLPIKLATYESPPAPGLHADSYRAGLMFFGTPHAGGNGTLVAVGSLVAEIATKLGFRPKSDIVSTLKDGSIFSDILQESFRHQLLSYQIVSYYEKIGNVCSYI